MLAAVNTSVIRVGVCNLMMFFGTSAAVFCTLETLASFRQIYVLCNVVVILAPPSADVRLAVSTILLYLL